ncbi:MAG: site-specific integrase [Proteobacteria bacterium]|nr:site-specific integrase [Pseudomonadota bacterium]
MKDTTILPAALFDSLEHLNSNKINFALYPQYDAQDVVHASAFLKCYRGSQGTFNSYRREVERLLQWTALQAKKSLKMINRSDIETYIRFCQKPPVEWIGTIKVPRFIESAGARIANPEWKPFVVTLAKSARKLGHQPKAEDFKLSNGAVQEIFAILSTFFNYLVQEEYLAINPVVLIRQKQQYIQRHQGPRPIRRLSELQWQVVIETAQKMANREPDKHERTLFILSALYSMYLRISELAATSRWQPAMHDFHRDSEGNWWFTTVGKGNKERQIAVSDTMLAALKRWRTFLGLTALPSPNDHTPLLPQKNQKAPIRSINHIRRIVQSCFDEAIDQLNNEGFSDEAQALSEATVHWLRHTGISDDVKHRPIEHVRDDAGHSSSLITDRYIDVNRKERHFSARKKKIVTA